MLSYVNRNFYHAQQHPSIFIVLVSSHQILKNKINCTHSLLRWVRWIWATWLVTQWMGIMKIMWHNLLNRASFHRGRRVSSDSAWTQSSLWSYRDLYFWASQSCFISSNCFFKREHLFIDKLMVITKLSVPTAQLLGLGSKLYPSNIQRMLNNKGLTRFLTRFKLEYSRIKEGKDRFCSLGG